MSNITDLLSRLHEKDISPQQTLAMQEDPRGWWKEKVRQASEQGIELGELLQDDHQETDDSVPTESVQESTKSKQ